MVGKETVDISINFALAEYKVYFSYHIKSEQWETFLCTFRKKNFRK